MAPRPKRAGDTARKAAEKIASLARVCVGRFASQPPRRIHMPDIVDAANFPFRKAIGRKALGKVERSVVDHHRLVLQLGPRGRWKERISTSRGYNWTFMPFTDEFIS